MFFRIPNQFFKRLSWIVAIGAFIWILTILSNPIDRGRDQPGHNGSRIPSEILHAVTEQAASKRTNTSFVPVHVSETLEVRSEKYAIRVALGLSTTTRKLRNVTKDNIAEKIVFLKTLVPSFCRTRSRETYYRYTFYISYDFDDPLLTKKTMRVMLTDTFREIVRRKCHTYSESRYISLKLVALEHHKKPAWAQNDAMMFAYLDGMDYFYRLNDDVEFASTNWTSLFIERLKSYDPPNVGMVSPNNSGEHPDHYEFDFVHKTHIDIFGFYYPRVFLDLYADEWIGKLYGGRSSKIPSVHLKHTQEMGKRYDETLRGGGASRIGFREEELYRDRDTLNRFLDVMKEEKQHPEKRSAERVKAQHQVISMSLAGKDPQALWGIIRNANLAKAFFPAWKLRVYIPGPHADQSLEVPTPILNKLKALEVELLEVPGRVESDVHFTLWKYLVLDDTGVNTVLIRDTRSRLIQKDYLVTNYFQSGTKSLGLCVCRQYRSKKYFLRDSALNLKANMMRARLKYDQNITFTEKIIEISEHFFDRTTKSLWNDGGSLKEFLSGFMWEEFSKVIKIVNPSLSSYTKHFDPRSHILPPSGAQSLSASKRNAAYIGRRFDPFETLIKFLMRKGLYS